MVIKASSISKARLNQLNQGLSATTNLAEWLAIDQSLLLNTLATVHDIKYLSEIAAELPKMSIPKQIAWIGLKMANLRDRAMFRRHASDTVRCWSCYADVTGAPKLLAALNAVRPFAEDLHFGVREIAWMSAREVICKDPIGSIQQLMPWANDKNEYLRRFASEATRPRGVWAKHIGAFKLDPTPALPLLDQLIADQSRYVQDSVANWLNDAGKDHPHWVRDVTMDWMSRSNTRETAYIVKRATRRINRT